MKLRFGFHKCNPPSRPILGGENCSWTPRLIANPKTVFQSLDPEFPIESTHKKK